MADEQESPHTAANETMKTYTYDSSRTCLGSGSRTRLAFRTISTMETYCVTNRVLNTAIRS